MRFRPLRQQSPVGWFVSILRLVLLLALAQSCNTPEPVCWGTCEDTGDCGSGLTCDALIGYCVKEVGHPANAEACNLEVDEVWVCAEREVQIPLSAETPNDGDSAQSFDVRGLPGGKSSRGNVIETTFEEGVHQIAWGDTPGRHLLTVNATSDCPTLDVASAPSECIGRDVVATLRSTGGKGEVTWSVVGEDHGYVLFEDGKLQGIATQNDTLTIALEDERGVRVEEKLTILALAGCPSIETKTIPASCAESVFEWQLDVAGLDLKFREPTVISRDPQGDLERLGLEVNKSDSSGYRLRAEPSTDAAGSYTVGLIVDNALNKDQVELPFEVRNCEKDKAVVCCNDEITVNLEQGAWSLTSPANNPMSSNVVLFDNQLNFARRDLSNGSYTLNLNNPMGGPESLLVLLKSPGDEGCAPEDGGTSTTDSDAADSSDDHTESNSGGTSTGDAGASEFPALPDGCVGFEYWSELLSPEVNASIEEVPGLRVEDGVLQGVPESEFSGTVWLEGQRYSLTVRETCYFAVIDTSSGARQLSLRSVGSPSSGVDVSFLPESAGEVQTFAFSPDGSTLAFFTGPTATASSGDGGSEDVGRLYVVPSNAKTPDDVVDLGDVGGAISEIAWSPSSQGLTALVGAGDDMHLAIFTRSTSGFGPAQSVDIARASRLLWFDDDNSCVLAAYAPDPDAPQAERRAVTCSRRNSSGVFAEVTSALPTAAYDIVQGKPSKLGILYYQQILESERGTLRFWDPLARATTAPSEVQVIHEALFASPKGDWVATPHPDLSLMEFANANVATAFPETYEPLSEVLGCETILSWSASGRQVACANLSNRELILVRFAENGSIEQQGTFGLEFSPTLIGRSVFSSNGAWYFFDDASDFDLGVVDLRGAEEEWSMQRQVLSHEGLELGLEALRHPDTAVIAVSNQPHLLNPLGEQPLLPLGGPVMKTSPSCDWYFHDGGFEGWCGGDAPRRFATSADSNFILLLDTTSQVHLLDRLRATETLLAPTGSCGSGDNACDHLFAFAPTRIGLVP